MRTGNKKSNLNPNCGCEVSTTQGKFYLEMSPRGLCRLSFPGKACKKAAGKESAALGKMKKLLNDYLKGKKVRLENVRFDLTELTPAEHKVIQELKKIPRGKVISYQELAKRAGFPRGARFIGNVMRKNCIPIFLPCHRVVKSDGSLGGYALGLPWKKRLLALEGRS